MRFATRRQAKDARIDWLLFYHRRRLHATPGYLGPLAFAKKRLADKDLPKKQGSPHRRSAKGDPRAGPEKAESGGDFQAARVMMPPAGSEEASLHGKTLFAGFAGTHDVGCSFRTVSTRGGADVRCQRELCDQAHAAGCCNRRLPATKIRRP